MSFTSHLQTNLLNNAFRNTNYTPPTKVYVGLLKGSTEVTGGGYARQEITFSAPAVDGAGMKITNSTEVKFPIASASWGNVTKSAIFDAKTAGNKLDEGELNAAREVRENDQFQIPIGDTGIKLD